MFYNGLTPAEAERLAMLAEECAEVIQVVGKILRHGYESHHPDDPTTNRDLLAKELGHVSAVRSLMLEDLDLDLVVSSKREKSKNFHKWTHHQEFLE